MRKVLLMLLALLALTGCKEKHERLIDEYLDAHLKDPGSYQNIEMGKPIIITPTTRAMEMALEKAKNGEFPLDSIPSKLKGLPEFFKQQGINGHDTLGWYVEHRYRAKNSYGATDIVEVVYTFDKGMDNIIDVRQK